jgi:hypothetical protein
MKISKHIDRGDILKYVAGILNKKEKKTIEEHIASCNRCILKIAHAFNHKIEACKKTQASLIRYHYGKSDKDMDDFISNHILYCNNCFEEYNKLVEKREKGIFGFFMGYIRNFDFSGLIPAYRETTLTAQSKGTTPEIKNFQELKRAGISAIVTDDSKGNLKVYLKSEKFDVSGVRVSIGSKIGHSFNEAISSKTTKRGIAHLGKIKDIPIPESRSGYILFISGLRMKSK